MSSLTAADKRYLDKILNMGGGSVLDFTNATFAEFFKLYNVDIHGDQFSTYGTSKAKKLRAFWEQESDALVGRVLSDMLDSYETACKLSGHQCDADLLAQSRKIITRLLGTSPPANVETVDVFLNKEFEMPSIQRLPVESTVAKLIENRLNEARLALSVKAHLSVIFLCGSALEGVLLGAARKEPQKFNQSPASPKDSSGKVKAFHEWSLAQFIDVACDIDLLKPDVKKFSHGLRDFRNYIHPYQQMLSKFTPDEHTAKVCWQVLKAALASIAGDRR